MVLAGLVSACAPAQGWSRTELETCAPAHPARVCSVASPDHGHTVTVADSAALVPGECASPPSRSRNRGGLVRVETRDPRGQTEGRWVRAPAGKVTIVAVEADGEPELVERRACDRVPVDLR